MANKIDVVITWVDGNDEEWKSVKKQKQNELFGESDDGENRYRDWDTLKYLLRSIEKNMSWVNKIFLITVGHIPNWLNSETSKLVLIKHEDYIPKEYLPTFNSNTIELNMHRIKELSENFIYFNDDMIVLNKCQSTDFFKNGKPCEIAALSPYVPLYESKNYCHILNTEIINKYFDKNKSIKKNFFKWINFKYGSWNFKTILLLPWNKFTGLKTQHVSTPMKKSTLSWLWENEYDGLNETCLYTFRNKLNYNQWIVSNIHIAKGDFVPRSKKFGTSFAFSDNENNNCKILNTIRNSKFKVICINDEVKEYNKFESLKEKMIIELERKFPNKSEFEK